MVQAVVATSDVSQSQGSACLGQALGMMERTGQINRLRFLVVVGTGEIPHAPPLLHPPLHPPLRCHSSLGRRDGGVMAAGVASGHQSSYFSS